MVIWEKRSRTAVSGHGYWSERKSSSSLQEGIHSGATEHMNTSGATEHRAERWQAALASANLGMAGKAFTGSKWENKHKPQLIRQFVELLSAPNVLSLNFTEIGNIDDPITDSGKNKFEEVLWEAFSSVFGKGTTKGTPQIIWPETEQSTTCAAWRGDVRVERLTSFKISTVQAFRTVERTLVTSAPEHGHQKLMVYNTHQPASEKRRFPPTSRLKCAHAIIAESIRDNSDMEGIVAL